MHLNLHTETPRQLLLRACYCKCAHSTGNAKATSETDQNHFKASTGKPRPNFTGAEVEVLLQNVDVSILFHYGYIPAIEFSAYLFIHCNLQCSCTFTFIFTHLADAFVQSDVGYKGENSQATSNRDLV